MNAVVERVLTTLKRSLSPAEAPEKGASPCVCACRGQDHGPNLHSHSAKLEY